jgi:hypothetical protein
MPYRAVPFHCQQKHDAPTGAGPMTHQLMGVWQMLVGNPFCRSPATGGFFKPPPANHGVEHFPYSHFVVSAAFSSASAELTKP